MFVGVMLVFLPARILGSAGIHRPARVGAAELAGIALAAAGLLLALWCVVTFALAGKGTPMPLDPPRRLVVTGPYRLLRNPMYLGAVLALTGAAIFYRSVGLLAYAVLFLAAAHFFVLGYEEPALARRFGEEYHAYQAAVRRWVPWR